MKLVETVVTNIEFEVNDVIMFLDQVGIYEPGDIVILREHQLEDRFIIEGARTLGYKVDGTREWLKDLLNTNKIKFLGELK